MSNFVCPIQTPESRDWYLKRAEEKRKRKAEKLKKMFEVQDESSK